MALTQHPKAAPALQPFELGPESTGDMATALPVSEMPADAVLTTDLGAHFDSMSDLSTTELAGGFVARRSNTSIGEMMPSLEQPSVATSEMAPDFGGLPQVEEPQMLAPDFDIHARTGRGQTQARQAAYAATADMAASFGPPGQPPAPAPRGPGSSPQRSLMPTTRPIADQSTQELAGHFLSAPNGRRDSDPMDQLGHDMFPPLASDGGGGNDRFSADEPYEATQMLDPGQFSVPLPTLEGGFEGDDPYEATQAIDAGAFGMPQSPFELDGHSNAPPSSSGYEVTVEFDNATPDEFDRTMEIAGGFLTAPTEPEAPLPELFPPLKP
jgi:hypothetical protein